ncbi:unnamed protein product (mitochondrion) [Plasmodiophora brassicae]|uniref:RGS domain-containing protein n=1 Tax=Plasmodiophora brassicae TaxID=37360 RepID=A0A0G4IYI8_PLABS|nr:hypothetical protein PBRA_007893 [Plasmodiophora brassicae]SPQ98965.1 unnamed protein product [Plasmodiophora brassicae]
MVSHDDLAQLAGFLAYDCTVQLAMVVAFVRRWHQTPIRERYPKIVLVIQGLAIVIPYGYWVAGQYRDSILANLVASVTFNQAALHGELIRVLLLYCNWRRTRANVLLGAADTGAVVTKRRVTAAIRDPHPGSNGKFDDVLQRQGAGRVDVFFARHPTLVREALWFKVYLIGMAADLVVVAAAYGACHGMSALPDSFNLFNNTCMLLQLLIVFVVIAHLGNCNDAFHIKFEITANAILGIAGNLVANYVIPPGGGANTTLQRLSAWIVTRTTIAVSLFMPVYWARRTTLRIAPEYGRMDRLLTVDVIRIAFTAYLEKEFAVESMLFYNARHQFTKRWSTLLGRQAQSAGAGTTTVATASATSHSDPSTTTTILPMTAGLISMPDELLDDADTIYETFIKVGSPFEINISSGLRRAYEALFEPDRPNPSGEDPTPTIWIDTDIRMFDRAWHELRSMLEHAAFRRFLEGDIAADLVKMG